MSGSDKPTYHNELLSQIQHLKWQWHDVYKWILSQHPSLRKYDQVLYNNLKQNYIDGSCLQTLSAHDWRLLGITELNHINILIDSIKNLFKIKQSAQRQNQNNIKLKNEANILRQSNNKLKTEIENLKIVGQRQQQMIQKLTNDYFSLNSQINQYDLMFKQVFEEQNIWIGKEAAYQKQIHHLNVIINTLNIQLQAAQVGASTANSVFSSLPASISVLQDKSTKMNVNTNHTLTNNGEGVLINEGQDECKQEKENRPFRSMQ